MQLETIDPSSKKDYTIDGTDWLADGETFASAEWTIPAGLTEVPAKGHGITDGVKLWIWLAAAAATLGDNYLLTAHFVTSAGREDDCTITIYCRAR